MDLPLPVRFEKILVYFQMPGNIFMYWDTIIDDITITNDKTIRATASITFSAGHDALGNFYEEEKGSVQFLSGNRLKASSNMQSFESGAETSWKQAGGRQDHKNTRIVKKEEDSTSEDSDPTVRYIGTDAAAFKTRSSTTVGRKRKYQELVDSNSVDELRVLCGTLQRQVNAVQARLSAVEYQHNQKQVSQTVRQVKMYIRYDIQRCIKRPHTKITGENDTEFHTILRRAPIQFSMACTLSDFTDLVSDLQSRFLSGIKYLPSSAVLSTGTNPLAPKHITFNNMYTLLSCLDINDMEAAKDLLVHKTFRKDVQILQLLGGAQWDYDNDERSLHIFVGHGCDRSSVPPTVKQENVEVSDVICVDDVDIFREGNPDERDTEAAAMTNDPSASANIHCITLHNRKWSVENGCFLSKFELGAANTGTESITYSTLMDHDAFTLSWRPLPGLRPQHLTMMGEQVVLGKLSVYLPAVLVIGAAPCKEVNSVLRGGADLMFPST